jgi:hypothetical protein
MSEFNGSTADMRRVFLPANDPSFRTDDFPTTRVSFDCGGVLPSVSLTHYKPGGPPFVLKTNSGNSFSFLWWLEGPTAAPGYWPVLIKEDLSDNNCIRRSFINSNSLVDVNKFMWVCLTNEAPRVVPGQVFEVVLGEYVELLIEMEGIRGNRIPESVHLLGTTTPFNEQTDFVWIRQGLRFSYNRRPQGFALPGSYEPSNGLDGDLPIFYGRPKLLGSHTFTVEAFNLHGSSRETFTLNVRERGISVSLKDWDASWTTYRGQPTPYRALELNGRDLSPPTGLFGSGGEVVSVFFDNISLTPNNFGTDQVVKGFQTALPIPGTSEPPTSNFGWSTEPREFQPDSNGRLNQLIFVRSNPFIGSTPFIQTQEVVTTLTGNLKFATSEVLFGRNNLVVQPLSSIVRPGNMRALGSEMFTVVFPLYCQVATSGNKAINRFFLDSTSFVYVSINGADPIQLTSSINLNAGWNRLVFIYTNTKRPDAAFIVDQIAGVQSWKAPASLIPCFGKKVKDCIPAVTSANGLVDEIAGIYYWSFGESGMAYSNGFPYRPVDFTEFPKDEYPDARGNDFIVQLHNNRTQYEAGLRNHALPESMFEVRSLSNRLEFQTDIRTNATPIDNNTVQFFFERNPSIDVKSFYFRVNMAAQIRQGLFSPDFDSVELRGDFSGWNPILGVRAPLPCSRDGDREIFRRSCPTRLPDGSEVFLKRTYENSTVYHFLVPLRADLGRTLNFKFYATSPNLGWEDLGSVDNRTFTLDNLEEIILFNTYIPVPAVNFNNAPTTPFAVGGLAVSNLYLGGTPVSKIHLGATQVYP